MPIFAANGFVAKASGLLVLVLAATASQSFAGSPDFVGTWVLNRDKSAGVSESIRDTAGLAEKMVVTADDQRVVLQGRKGGSDLSPEEYTFAGSTSAEEPSATSKGTETRTTLRQLSVLDEGRRLRLKMGVTIRLRDKKSETVEVKVNTMEWELAEEGRVLRIRPRLSDSAELFYDRQ